MSAPPVLRLMDEFKQDMMAMREYELVSVDDTVKICMPVQGQNLPSATLYQIHTETYYFRKR